MYYRQPKYFAEFKCIGPECTANCCYGWRIDWTKSEVDKVKNAPNCSADLKTKVENGFIPKDANEKGEEIFIVKFDDRERCPCVTEEGLCQIQKELGAEYLSRICTIYPRYNSFVDFGNAVYRGCHISCQEVVRKLINDEDSMELVDIPTSDTRFYNMLNLVNKSDIETYPELKHQTLLAEFFYELIGDKNSSVETNIVFGALASQKLTQLIDDNKSDVIPDALNAFKKQVHNAAALRSIDNIKPNYNVKFGVTDKIIENALDFKMTDVLKNENGDLDIERYLIGEAKLNEMMKDKPFWLRNIALDLLLELGVPFKSKRHTVFENYSFFVAAVSCLKLNAIAAAFAHEKVDIHTKGQSLHFEGIEKIYGLTGIISRRFFQTDKAFKNVIKVLREFEMGSPAYLALLVK